MAATARRDFRSSRGTGKTHCDIQPQVTTAAALAAAAAATDVALVGSGGSAAAAAAAATSVSAPAGSTKRQQRRVLDQHGRCQHGSAGSGPAREQYLRRRARHGEISPARRRRHLCRCRRLRRALPALKGKVRRPHRGSGRRVASRRGSPRSRYANGAPFIIFLLVFLAIPATLWIGEGGALDLMRPARAH